MATHNGEPGMAHIKPEFLILDHKPVVDTEYVSKNVKEELEKDEKNPTDTNEPPTKKIKLKGRNKKRPKGKRKDASEKLCPAVVHERACAYGEKCKFSHDKQKFLESKPVDIGDQCYLYDTYGKCDFGITCRWAKCHLSENLDNLQKENFTSDKPRVETVKNILKKDLQVSLWKRKYDFSRSNKVLDEICPEANKFLKDKDKQAALNRNKIKSNEKLNSSGVDKRNGCPEVNGHEHNTDHEVDKVDTDNTSDRGEVTVDNSDNKIDSSDVSVSEVTVDNSDNEIDSSDVSVSLVTVDNSDNKIDSSDVSVSVVGSTIDSLSEERKDGVTLPETVKDNDVVNSTDIKLETEGVIKLRPQEKKVINFADKLYLAPLTTVGNLPFRRICKEYGADITCGEMAVSTNLLQGQQSEWALLKRHESEDIFGVQICGAYPDSMTRCAQLITESMDVDFIDINCGCPIDLIFNKGEGSALMGRLSKFEQIVKGMKAVIDVPLTAKIRTGIYSDKSTAHTLVPQLRDWGCALTTIHGRSRVQRYTKLADWDYISECATAAAPMPLFGNGDILSYEEANQRREETGVSGIMLARGALIKPWLFQEIKEQKHWDISSHERFEMLKKFANYGLDHWGSDHQGVENTRRFLLEWLSFLYRYVPVGILKRVPQRINERPPYYKGRDDVETLMGSPNCGDWIKISEMLLGPVPDDFSFLPKHKANAYK